MTSSRTWVIGRFLPPIRELAFLPQLADHLMFGAVVGAVVSWRRPRQPACRAIRSPIQLPMSTSRASSTATSSRRTFCCRRNKTQRRKDAKAQRADQVLTELLATLRLRVLALILLPLPRSPTSPWRSGPRPTTISPARARFLARPVTTNLTGRSRWMGFEKSAEKSAVPNSENACSEMEHREPPSGR